MSDHRIRSLERKVAATLSCEALVELDAARRRIGDGPWLPVRRADAWRRTSDALIQLAVLIHLMLWLRGSDGGVEGLGDLLDDQILYAAWDHSEGPEGPVFESTPRTPEEEDRDREWQEILDSGRDMRDAPVVRLPWWSDPQRADTSTPPAGDRP